MIYDKRVARKLLSVMQGDNESCVFRIEKFTGHGWTDTVPYLKDWLEIIKDDLSPATYKDYVISCHSSFQPIMEKIRRDDLSPFFFTCKTSRSEGNRYTSSIMNKLWKKACLAAGEEISMYAGLKHSSCSQYINEKGISISELQMITDHSRVESVQKYAKVEMSRRRELMETKIRPFPKRYRVENGE